MKTIIFFFALVFSLSQAIAQKEKSAYRVVSDNFVTFYNNGQADSIFALFSAEMKSALPIEKTREFLSELMGSYGKIEKKDFYKYNNSYAVYKTKFERILFALNISLDGAGNINGLFINPFKEDNLPKIPRNSTKLRLPFEGEWFVFWGGDTKELNYHIESEAQKNAFDFIIHDNKGNSFKTDGKTNDDYYAFGKPIYSACDGEVVLAVNGVKDNIPGISNPFFPSGNTIIIKTANNEYILYAHFKQNSIDVKQGDKVSKGHKLGHCGNSGNSSEPHLHFHIQNVEDCNIATGVKCYFDDFMVNGAKKQDYSPIKGEKIKNLEK